jgi:hypothetical protein
MDKVIPSSQKTSAFKTDRKMSNDDIYSFVKSYGKHTLKRDYKNLASHSKNNFFV